MLNRKMISFSDIFWNFSLHFQIHFFNETAPNRLHVCPKQSSFLVQAKLYFLSARQLMSWLRWLRWLIFINCEILLFLMLNYYLLKELKCKCRKKITQARRKEKSSGGGVGENGGWEFIKKCWPNLVRWLRNHSIEIV